MAFLVLLRVTLQQPAYRKLDEAEVDRELALHLRTIASPLSALGFEELGFVRVRRTLRSSDDRADLLELFHPGSATFAMIACSETPDRSSSAVSFFTERGREGDLPLMTLNGLSY